MQRRELITLLGGAAVASSMFRPRAARAQPSGKVVRIGFLGAIRLDRGDSVEAERLLDSHSAFFALARPRS